MSYQTRGFCYKYTKYVTTDRETFYFHLLHFDVFCLENLICLTLDTFITIVNVAFRTLKLFSIEPSQGCKSRYTNGTELRMRSNQT